MAWLGMHRRELHFVPAALPLAWTLNLQEPHQIGPACQLFRCLMLFFSSKRYWMTSRKL